MVNIPWLEVAWGTGFSSCLYSSLSPGEGNASPRKMYTGSVRIYQKTPWHNSSGLPQRSDIYNGSFLLVNRFRKNHLA